MPDFAQYMEPDPTRPKPSAPPMDDPLPEVKTRKSGPLDRAFQKREFALNFRFGTVVEHFYDGFGFGSDEQAVRIRSLDRVKPPVGSHLAIATGAITRSFGRRCQSVPVLLGYASPETGVKYTRANWSLLIGQPLLRWLLLLPGAVYAAHAYLAALDNANIIMIVVLQLGLMVYALWPFTKLWQMGHARYAFRAHVSQLHKVLGR